MSPQPRKPTENEATAWMTPGAIGFIAGVFATALLVVLISNHRAVLAVLGRLGELKSKVQPKLQNVIGKEKKCKSESVEREMVEDEGDENQAAVTMATPPALRVQKAFVA